MAEKASAKTAVVTYQSPRAALSRNLVVITAACFIVFFPLPVLFQILVPVIHGIPEAVLLSISMLSLFLFLMAFFSYRNNKNTRLILTDTGISLPGNSPTEEIIPWSRVELIEVSGDSTNPDTIIFSIKGLAPMRLKIASFAHEDLDKLVSACELWANQTAKDFSFNRLVETVTHKRRGNDDSSFTALWMEEAQRRLSTTPFTPLEPGTQLQDGRIKVVQPLTAGGWSAIYLCQWQERSQAVLKEAVVPPMAKDELKKKAYEHFEREAVLLAGLKHPQIARVHDYFIENGRQYMVLQRISGANLRSYVRDKGAASQKQAAKWARELVEIITYLHAQDPPIVHRDLTPENLILDMRGSLVLIDFGSANEFVGTVTGTLVGKPSYIAPEQFSGHARLESDLYSLGAVLHFIITGKDPEPLMVSHPKAQFPLISDAADKLVSDLTQLDFKKRIQTIAEVKDRLVEAFGNFDEPQKLVDPVQPSATDADNTEREIEGDDATKNGEESQNQLPSKTDAPVDGV